VCVRARCTVHHAYAATRTTVVPKSNGNMACVDRQMKRFISTSRRYYTHLPPKASDLDRAKLMGISRYSTTTALAAVGVANAELGPV
jgi:hypothetical protein